mgnify:CR=1 FL=1
MEHYLLYFLSDPDPRRELKTSSSSDKLSLDSLRIISEIPRGPKANKKECYLSIIKIRFIGSDQPTLYIFSYASSLQSSAMFWVGQFFSRSQSWTFAWAGAITDSSIDHFVNVGVACHQERTSGNIHACVTNSDLQ